jgi:TolB protein
VATLTIGQCTKATVTVAALASLTLGGCAVRAPAGAASRHKHVAGAVQRQCPVVTAGRKTRARGGILLDGGRTGTRSQVPWAKVGPGWVLAEYSATVVPDSSAKPRLGPVSLYLIDPAGGKYLMYRWKERQGQSLPALIDWSADAAKALIGQQPNEVGYPPTRVMQLTLATGAVTSFHVPWNVYPQAYATPDGGAMLATSGDQRIKLIRYCLTGRRGPALASAENLEFSESGSGVVAVSGTTGIKLVDATGRIIRWLPVPGAQAAAAGCGPIRWWNARTVLAVCPQHGLWLIPADGAAPRHLSPARNGHGVDPNGDVGAWALPSGLYLQAVGACSQLYIVRQLPSGRVQSVNIPGTYGNNNRIINSLGTRLLVRAQTGCPGSDSLLWFDPATRAVQMLLSAPRDVIGVLAAIPRVNY